MEPLGCIEHLACHLVASTGTLQWPHLTNRSQLISTLLQIPSSRILQHELTHTIVLEPNTTLAFSNDHMHGRMCPKGWGARDCVITHSKLTTRARFCS